MLVPAEMLGVSAGLGYFILDTRDRLAYDELMAAIIVVGALGYSFGYTEVEAKTEVDTCRALAPRYPGCALLEANVLKKLGRDAEAQAAYERAVALTKGK